jgi:hypothetical protein
VTPAAVSSACVVAAGSGSPALKVRVLNPVNGKVLIRRPDAHWLVAHQRAHWVGSDQIRLNGELQRAPRRISIAPKGAIAPHVSTVVQPYWVNASCGQTGSHKSIF